MSRYSSITHPGVWSGNGKPAVRVRELVCVQLQVMQGLDVIVARGTQKPSPERAHMIPSRAQVLMVAIRNEPQMAQAELRHNARNPVGHCKQRRGEAGVLPGSAPGDGERISHQLDSPLAREQAHWAGWPALPGDVALRSLPPCLVSEVNISEQKRASTRPTACRRIKRCPEIPVHAHHLRQGAGVALPDDFRHLPNEPLVEFVNELETGNARPGRELE